MGSRRQSTVVAGSGRPSKVLNLATKSGCGCSTHRRGTTIHTPGRMTAKGRQQKLSGGQRARLTATCMPSVAGVTISPVDRSRRGLIRETGWRAGNAARQPRSARCFAIPQCPGFQWPPFGFLPRIAASSSASCSARLARQVFATSQASFSRLGGSARS
jgi:hypothetical protein